MRFSKPHEARLEDAKAEAVRKSADVRIAELQNQVLAMPVAKVFADIQLPNGTSVVVNHNLGREPAMVWVSPIRSVTPGGIGSPTPGEVAEIRGPTVNRRQAIVLIAGGFGATVVVDVAVF